MNRNLSVELRPSKLADVIGHRQTVAAITKQLATRVPVAFLFSGQPGVGKTTLARIIANELGASEVTELNASDTNGVADIRELVKNTEYLPMSGKYRVLILDEAQRLTEPAQNVLLKSFENPGSTIWVIATTEPSKLLPALRGRCVSYHLAPMDEMEVRELITRAMVASGKSDKSFDILKLGLELKKAEIFSPREVLMACERFFLGIPADEAVQKTDEPVEYFEIARAVWKGDWDKTSGLLKSLKSADVRGLRSVIAGYGKKILLDGGNPVVAECLTGLAQYQIYEDGIAFAVTTAILFKICKKMNQA